MIDQGPTDLPVAGREGEAVDVGDASLPKGPTSTLAARFRQLASEDFVGYCPIYERIALGIADDPSSLGLIGSVAPVGQTPILALAAVHDLVLTEPDRPLATIYAGRSTADPWPAFRQLLHDEHQAVLDRMRSRPVQTNEVGRSAVLAPAFSWVRARADGLGDHRPLALVEIGPSAGLNLLLDRYSITFRPEADETTTWGDPSSLVRLDCALRGPGRPPLGPSLEIGSRTGIDLAPVDVTDDDACRWLAACVWPGLPDRSERLASALEVARRDPPRLHEGDAVTDIAPLVAALEPDVMPVVFATWALAYLGREGRIALLTALDALGTSRDLVLVTAEDHRITPWVPDLPPAVASRVEADGDGTATVVGVRSWQGGATSNEVLAVSHPHGRWMAWGPGPDPT